MKASSMKLNVVRAICYAAFFAFTTYLFYLECTEVLVSDIPTHINQALKSFHAYSVMSVFITVAYTIAQEFGVAVLLGLFEIATVLVCEMLMRKLAPDVNRWAIFICAFCCNVAIAIWVPFIHPYLTRGLSIGNAWHNTTFTAMRLVGLGAIWFYLRFIGRFESKNHKLDYAVFALLVILSACTKPNFVLSFGPALAIVCIYDLKKEGTATLKRSLALAVPFVLALAVIPFQTTALYGGGVSSGIGIGFFSVWRRFHFFIPIAMLQSYAFPLIALCACVRMRYRDRNYQLTWAIFFVSLFIYAFLKETGTRKLHGNFGWGLMFAVYYLMIVSVCAYLQTRRKNIHLLLGMPLASTEILKNSGLPVTYEEDLPETPEEIKKSKAFDACALTLFALHTISGIISIGSILAGNGYA